LAVDTEFHGEKTRYPKLCLVQLASRDEVVVVDALTCNGELLAPLFADPGRLWLLHAASGDIDILDRWVGERVKRLFDVQLAARFLGHRVLSLQALADTTIGLHLDKHSTLEDWTRRPVSPSALEYAADDVAWLHDIHAALVAQLDGMGRLDWVVDECTAIAAPTPERPADEAWWSFAGKLPKKPRNRAVAQCLCAWRDERSRRRNLPEKIVLSDLAVMAIASSPPRSERALGDVRGAGNLNPALRREVFAAIERGLALPPEQLRTPPKALPTGPRQVVSLLTAWVSQRAYELDLDSTLLATRDDIDAFAVGRAGRLDHGWRGDAVGADLAALKAGRRALATDGGSRLRLVDVP
jgi:ribonuclease D